MKYLKYILPRKALQKIYISRIRSMIEYFNVLYDNCPKYMSDRLESVQLDSARVCTGALPQSNCQKTLSETGWETLQTHTNKIAQTHSYKIVNQLVPDYLHSHCPDLVLPTSAYNTRQSNSLRFPICRTSAFKNSFFPSTAHYWNGIDIHTRNSESLSIFKNKVKSMFQTSNAPKFYYTSIYRIILIHHTRLRLNMSSLNSQLHRVGCSETAECLCSDIETPQHYILKCPLYSAPRHKLLKAIRHIIAPGVHHSILPHLDPFLFVNIVLKGFNDAKADENVNICKAFQHFIIESGRFK